MMNMMPKILQYFSIILLSGVDFTYANYCTDGEPNCCEFNGLNQKTCNGYGTSSVTQFLNAVFKGRTQILVAGSCGGFYYIFDFTYEYEGGAQVIGRFKTIYGFCLQVRTTPSSPPIGTPKKTEFKLYCWEVTSCLTFYEVTSSSIGSFRGTDFPLTYLYALVKTYCDSKSCTLCNIVYGDGRQDNNGLLVNALRNDFIAYLNGLLSFDFAKLPYKGKSGVCIDPNIEFYQTNYNIEPAACQNSISFIEKGYPISGKTISCNNPNGQPAIGDKFSSFNFSTLNTPGGRAAFSQMLGTTLGGSTLTYFAYSKWSITERPYDCAYQVNTLSPSTYNYEALRSFFEASA